MQGAVDPDREHRDEVRPGVARASDAPTSGQVVEATLQPFTFLPIRRERRGLSPKELPK